MPIYEFKCPECGYQFEKLMRVSDDNPTCPNEIVPFERSSYARPFWLKARQALVELERPDEIQWYGGRGEDLINIHEHTEGLINYRWEKGVGINVCMSVADWIRKESRPCGGETIKLVSQTTFALKGGGWATDGYIG